MNIEKIVEEIKDVNINLATMHPSEYEEVARLLFGEIMENGWYGMDEINDVLEKLPYPQEIKDHIENIADVICDLRDQPKTSGRKPASYVRVMKKFLNNT